MLLFTLYRLIIIFFANYIADGSLYDPVSMHLENDVTLLYPAREQTVKLLSTFKYLFFYRFKFQISFIMNKISEHFRNKIDNN